MINLRNSDRLIAALTLIEDPELYLSSGFGQRLDGTPLTPGGAYPWKLSLRGALLHVACGNTQMAKQLAMQIAAGINSDDTTLFRDIEREEDPIDHDNVIALIKKAIDAAESTEPPLVKSEDGKTGGDKKGSQTGT